MRFAYADPPYLGRAEYYRAHHPDWREWNDTERHRRLIGELTDRYPDGWVLSLSEDSLRTILPMAPEGSRVCCWITDRARFAGKGIAPRRHFEPVILCGGRPWEDTGNRCADFIVTQQERTPGPRYQMNREDIRRGKTFVGRKPRAFALWVLDLLGWQPGDEVHDLFPGSGAVSAAWLDRWLEEETA